MGFSNVKDDQHDEPNRGSLIRNRKNNGNSSSSSYCSNESNASDQYRSSSALLDQDSGNRPDLRYQYSRSAEAGSVNKYADDNDNDNIDENSNNSNDDDSNQDDPDDESSGATSFPTQEDLESIIVQPPESVPGDDIENRSVSSIEYFISASRSMRSVGSMESVKERIESTGGGSIEEGGSSVGGMSENGDIKLSFAEGDIKLSFTGIDDASVGKVVITTFPKGMTYAASVKSDAATVCSGSVTEDIDMASVGTVHSSNPNSTPHAIAGQSPFLVKQERRKHERGVGFATETSTTWTHSVFSSYPVNKNQHATALDKPQAAALNVPHATALFRASPVQGNVLGSLSATGIAMNDMGPPLNRSLLERANSTGLSSLATSLAGSIRSYASSTGTMSRPSSVKSFGSLAASEVVHVDADDCGGSIALSDGLIIDETLLEDRHHISDRVTFSTTEVIYSMMGTSNMADPPEESGGDHGAIQPPNCGLTSLHDRLSVDQGRISPGGTVYKGRGVRHYQGRYMHLPLQRFHCSIDKLPLEGTVIGHETKQEPKELSPRHQMDHWHRGRSWSRSRSRSRSLSRSRSRSRDRSHSRSLERECNRGGNQAGTKQAWSRSRSPPKRRIRSPQHVRDGRDFRGGGRKRNMNSNDQNRWRNNRPCRVSARCDSPAGPRNRNKSHRGRSCARGGRQRHNSPSNRGMTPRDPRHREANRK